MRKMHVIVDSHSFNGIEILARPQQGLCRHLLNMLNEAKKIKKPNLEIIRGISDPHIKKELNSFFTDLLILAHDFGKVNPFFQMKLQKKQREKHKKTLTYHSQLGGLFAWLVGLNYYNKRIEKLSDPKNKTEFNVHLLSVIYAIFNHHNNRVLPNTISHSLTRYGNNFTYDDMVVVIEKLNSYYYNKTSIEELSNHALSKTESSDDDPLFEYFNNCYKETSIDSELIYDSIQQLRELTDADDVEFLMDEMEEEWAQIRTDNRLFLTIMYYYSILCDLDEWDAKSYIDNTSEHDIKFENKMIPVKESTIEEYKKEKFPEFKNEKANIDPLQKVKDDLWVEVLKYLQKKEKNEGIISLTYPTGSGKTLSFLHLAINLRTKIYEETGVYPRIIYCLPFISITDQVGGILKDILLKEEEKKEFAHKQSDLLTIHHHIAESEWSYYSENDDKYEFNIKKLKDYIYLWNSNFIVTTFVSFWNSMLGGKKRNSLRFHRIVGSIIILDEIQSIPIKYWQLVSAILNQLSEIFGCKIIIGSATNPEAISYNYEWNKYQTSIYSINYHIQTDKLSLNRYFISYSAEREELQNFAVRLSDVIIKNKTKSIMAVLNTKESARLLFNYIKEKFDDEKVMFLSSTVTYEDRMAVIDFIKELNDYERSHSADNANVKNKHSRVILICTQVIEAGIDVSFDIVFRDMAPLESIIQVAGRCNRYNKKEKGEVYVIELTKPEKKNIAYYRMIYDNVMIQETKKILSNHKMIEEKDVTQIVKEYYDQLSLKGEKKNSKCGVEEINKTLIENLTEKFKLIEEQETETIIIVENEKQYLELFNYVDQHKNIKTLYKFREKTISLSKKLKESIKNEIKNENKLFPIIQNGKWTIWGYLMDSEGDMIYQKEGGLNIPLLNGSKKLDEFLA